MAKFKISLDMKLNIEGERDDIAVIAANLRQQLGNALDPAAQIVNGEQPRKVVESIPVDNEVKTKPRRRNASPKPADGAANPAVQTWVHDNNKWGFPREDWNTVQKSVWLLHVATAAVSVKEMSPTEIAETFNKMFKPAGQLRPSNVSRDLNKNRADDPAFVSMDVKTNKYFLTISGTAEAEKLCNAAKGSLFETPSAAPPKQP